ncbi:MAG TPA: UbiD family decarboxylase, partial [Chloroflexota bacterium]|nr:UbiD family decarboxylase [Chloroflexota bacterium]
MAAPDRALATTRRDLRSHLAELEARGLLVRVSRPIDKDTELHPLVRWQFRGLAETQRKAFLFENVRDSRGRAYDMPVVVGALAGSEEIYALSMACRSEEVPDVWRTALASPLPAIVVNEAPVQEVVHMGDGLLEHGGLDELPVP